MIGSFVSSALRKYVGRRLFGNLLLAVNWLTRGKRAMRDAGHQARIDAAGTSLSLYIFRDCPFCIKVLRFLHQSNMTLDLRDAEFNELHKAELVSRGGHYQVPCLRITSANGNKEQWLYESDDIIAYLDHILTA